MFSSSLGNWSGIERAWEDPFTTGKSNILVMLLITYQMFALVLKGTHPLGSLGRRVWLAFPAAQ